MREIRNVGAVTFVTVAMGLSAGCGGVHGIPIDQTATKIAQTVCPKAWGCCTVDQLNGNGSSGAGIVTETQTCTTDVAPCEHECEVRTAEDFRKQLATIQKSVDQKRAVYEEAKVNDCLTTIRESTCPDLNMTNHLTGVPGCDAFATPLVEMAGACSQDYECKSGWCKPPAGGGFADGSCQAPMSGMSCTTESCGKGFACDGRGTNDETDDMCVASVADGAACTSGAQCRSGLCTSSGGAMTCAPLTNACFYGSGCSTVGGPPGVVSLVLLTGLATIVAARNKRARRRRPSLSRLG